MQLPKFLNEPESPLKAILFGWALVTIPALGLSALVGWLFPPSAQPDFPATGLVAFVALVIFAPLLETLIMAGALEVLRRFLTPWAAAIVSGIGWGIAHSLQALAWGFVIWWVFLILSRLYLVWRPKNVGWALTIPFAVHALNNLGPALLISFR